MRRMLMAGLSAAIAGCGLVVYDATRPATADAVHVTSAGPVAVDLVADGLDNPWGVAPLPGGGALITERDGRLWLFAPDWSRRAVSGVPAVRAERQGGLLDVTVARDFAETGTVWLTYAEADGGGARTAMAAARLDREAAALRDVAVLFRQTPTLRGGRHFGSRVVEAPDGTLIVTTGDRGDAGRAQDLDTHVGKVIRIARDGSVPADNPFADGRSPGGATALPEIWSYGHRNIQGADFDAEGRLWTLSHGARGGDEVNHARAGRNYGWPVISYGTAYSGAKIGVGTEREGLEQPAFYWDPSIAPSGMTAYDGGLFPDWQGDLFVGALKYDTIVRLDREGERITGEERLFEDVYGRIRVV
ncbi:MAG: PQQ-dependent sugar dehydrogenase, partial [Pseudomonadota bacterium]